MCQSWGDGDLPGGPVVNNLLCNARDAGPTPGQGTKIPRATEQLSPHTATRAPGAVTKGPHDAAKVPGAAAKPRHSQTDQH